mmetsp:Transcript_55564/g.92342  ORF Transcript_55564/g.92342 Transcript_55564/m.92342 type:complete len:209 (+) Transcript_55564:807-1433(+)
MRSDWGTHTYSSPSGVKSLSPAYLDSSALSPAATAISTSSPPGPVATTSPTQYFSSPSAIVSMMRPVDDWAAGFSIFSSTLSANGFMSGTSAELAGDFGITPITSDSRMRMCSSPATVSSVKDTPNLLYSTQSPALRPEAWGPAPTTSPEVGFVFIASGSTRPPVVVSSAGASFTRTKSRRGVNLSMVPEADIIARAWPSPTTNGVGL